MEQHHFQKIPWLAPYTQAPPTDDDRMLVQRLAIHVLTHRDVLHRIDGWLDPQTKYTYATTTTTKTTAASFPTAGAVVSVFGFPFPVPLRIGDLLCYNFYYLPILTHTMIYVGCGHVVHYRPEIRSSDGEITIADINEDFDASQRRRMYVCPQNGHTHLSRYQVAMRALATVGKYADLSPRINCQHITERILGNAWFSIGIPRVAAMLTALISCAVALIVLTSACPWLPRPPRTAHRVPECVYSAPFSLAR